MKSHTASWTVPWRCLETSPAAGGNLEFGIRMARLTLDSTHFCNSKTFTRAHFFVSIEIALRTDGHHRVKSHCNKTKRFHTRSTTRNTISLISLISLLPLCLLQKSKVRKLTEILTKPKIMHHIPFCFSDLILYKKINGSWLIYCECTMV